VTGDELMLKTTVAAIIHRSINNTELVLLVRRGYAPYKNYWCLPGGHIDSFEPVQDAVVREVKEETGLEFIPSFFDYFDEIIPENNIHAVVIAFEGRGIGEEMKGVSEEVKDMGWFSLEEIKSMQLAFKHNQILDVFSERFEGR
jgi:8-oxo-dGTP diphosphatase